MSNMLKKFIIYCIGIYILLFCFMITVSGLPGSDFVGGTFTYFGFVILSSVLIRLFETKGNDS